MPRKNRRERPVEDAATNRTVHGAPIADLPTSALLMWLHHFAAPSPTHRALADEIASRREAVAQ